MDIYEQILEAFNNLATEYVHRSDMPSDDPKVDSAYRLFEQWVDSFDSQDNPTQLNFKATILFFEAGFRDPDDLVELIDEFLLSDYDDATAAGLVELAEAIKAKIAEIQKVIDDSR